MGSSYDDLRCFPEEPRRQAGFQLGKVQAGLEPDDWKPFNEVGAGTREKFDDAIYVLHCFQKKTQATSEHDKRIAKARYKAVAR